MDLVIRGGTAVTVGGRATVDIGVENGRILQLGGEMSADKELDAAGLFITPGGVDPHVHLTPPTRQADGWKWSDDFESGTRAALAGGVTTVGNISFPERDQTLADAIANNMQVGVDQKQNLLETLYPLDRLNGIATMLEGELERLRMDRRIHNKVKKQM